MTVVKRTACFLFAIAASTLQAQEIEATVSIDTRQLRSEDRAVFSGFVQQATDYLKGYQWTGAEWPHPKVRMSIQVALTQSTGNGNYTAQLLVVSQRLGADGEQLSPLIRVLDPSWQFNYLPGSPMYHSPGSFNSLASAFDFYANLALGCELDTRANLGGSAFLRRAYEICLQGQSDASAAGWSPGLNGYSRFSYVSELVDPRYELLRRLAYSYHSLGLDQIASSPEPAAQALRGVVDSLLIFKSSLKGPSVSLDRFCDAKYQELAQLFQIYPDKSMIYQELETIDPSHQIQYEEARNK